MLKALAIDTAFAEFIKDLPSLTNYNGNFGSKIINNHKTARKRYATAREETEVGSVSESTMRLDQFPHYPQTPVSKGMKHKNAIFNYIQNL